MNYQLGLLGGGQLARMSIQAAQRMGINCISLDPGSNTPASKIAPSFQGALHDPEAIAKIFDSAEWVTLENEFIPAQVIEAVIERGGHDPARLIPGKGTLRAIQDKLVQRQTLNRHGVPSPVAVPLEGDGEEALEAIGLPMVLKARFGGYDGKGTRYARTFAEWEKLKRDWKEGGWLAESFVPFTREVAVMVAVGSDATYCFPTVETIQTNSVCDLVFPCRSEAGDIAIAAVKAFEGKGLFGVELFELEDGSFQVNEIAPRPHNSGHYTLDWGGPSQFEFHVRTVLGLPLFAPTSGGFAVMANLLGKAGASSLVAATAAALTIPNSYVHWYGKDEVKQGRKMGHLNVTGPGLADLPSIIEAAVLARNRFYEAW